MPLPRCSSGLALAADIAKSASSAAAAGLGVTVASARTVPPAAKAGGLG
jgi:copper(I)-binding protein